MGLDPPFNSLVFFNLGFRLVHLCRTELEQHQLSI